MDKKNCVYDYANKCDCSEDDRCGCTYPNNMSRDFDCKEIPSTAKHRRFPDKYRFQKTIKPRQTTIKKVSYEKHP